MAGNFPESKNVSGSAIKRKTPEIATPTMPTIATVIPTRTGFVTRGRPLFALRNRAMLEIYEPTIPRTDEMMCAIKAIKKFELVWDIV